LASVDALPPTLLETPMSQEKQLTSLPPKFSDYRPPLMDQEKSQPQYVLMEEFYSKPKLNEYLPPLFGEAARGENLQNDEIKQHNLKRKTYTTKPGWEYVANDFDCREYQLLQSARCQDLFTKYTESAQSSNWSEGLYPSSTGSHASAATLDSSTTASYTPTIGAHPSTTGSQLSYTSYRRPSDSLAYFGPDSDHTDKSTDYYYPSTELANRQSFQPEQSRRDSLIPNYQSHPNSGVSQERLTNGQIGHVPYQLDHNTGFVLTDQTIYREDLNLEKEDSRLERRSTGLPTVPCMGASKFFLEECVLTRSNKFLSLGMDVP